MKRGRRVPGHPGAVCNSGGVWVVERICWRRCGGCVQGESCPELELMPLSSRRPPRLPQVRCPAPSLHPSRSPRANSRKRWHPMKNAHRPNGGVGWQPGNGSGRSPAAALPRLPPACRPLCPPPRPIPAAPPPTTPTPQAFTPQKTSTRPQQTSLAAWHGHRDSSPLQPPFIRHTPADTPRSGAGVANPWET